MRRHAIILVILLAAAAAAQTAVAYALALRPWEITDEPWPQELVQQWPGPVPDGWSTQPSGIVVHPQRIVSCSTLAWDWQGFHGVGDDLAFELNMWRIGWPFRSFGAYRHGQMFKHGRIYREPPPWRPQWQAEWIKGRVQPPAKPGDPPRVWPMYPIWSGFVLNTLFFAAVPAVLWCGLAATKCAVRRRRGQCVACGYELAGLAMCPECGVPRGHSSKAATEQSSR